MEVGRCFRRLSGKRARAAKLALVSLCCVHICAAQDTTPKRGFQPGVSYALSDFETIDTTYGNLMLRFPIGSLPAGRGGMSAQLSLIYNSKLYDSKLEYFCDGNLRHQGADRNGVLVQRNKLFPTNDGGWKYAIGYRLEPENRIDAYVSTGTGDCSPAVPQCPSEEAMYNYRLRLVFPDGSSRQMRLHGQNPHQNGYYRTRHDGYMETCQIGGQWLQQNLVYYSTDGTYARLVVEHDSDDNPANNPWTLTLGDGTRVTDQEPLPDNTRSPHQRIYDRNNNYVEIRELTNYNNVPGRRATQLVDQLNRSVTLDYSYAPGEHAVHEAGFGQPLTWRIKWKTVWVRKHYELKDPADPALAEYPTAFFAQLHVVDQIIMPQPPGADSLAYSFGYSGSQQNPSPNTSPGWGELNSITLPSEARADYSWKMDALGDSTADWLHAGDVLKNHPTAKTLRYHLEYDGTSTPTTETWLYGISSSSSTVTAPDGGTTEEQFGDTAGTLFGAGLTYKMTRADGTVVERVWERNIPHGLPVTLFTPDTNPYVKTEFTSIRDAGGVLVRTAIKDYNYDKNGNVTRVAEYDWMDYARVARDQQGRPTGALPQTDDDGRPLRPKRVTTNDYYAATQDASVNSAPTGYEYQFLSSPRLRNLPRATEVSSPSGLAARTEYTYDDALTTGNLTRESRWDSTKSAALGASFPKLSPANSVSVRHEYDDNTAVPALRYGNRTLTEDARGTRTKFTYGQVNGVAGLYLTETRAAQGTAVEQVVTREYDFETGLVTRETDANAVITRNLYDAFGRPTLVVAAEGADAEAHTRVIYDDSGRRVATRNDLSAPGDGRLVGVIHYDQLGRMRLSRQLEDGSIADEALADETLGIKVQTRYLYSGPNSYQLVSNPYRAADSAAASVEATMGWARTTTDAGGRAVEVKSFSGGRLPSPWATDPATTNVDTTGTVTTLYDGQFTVVTDQAGNARRSMADALGRLVRVDEPAGSGLGSPAAPSQPTCYSYDTLSNLAAVRQGGQWQFHQGQWQCVGGQERAFEFSSLSLLVSATNPENGAASYEYDENGNLRKRIDPRTLPNSQTRVTTAYEYDNLNRVTSRTYNDGTPNVAYIYDSQPLPAAAAPFERGKSTGRLVALTYGGTAAGYYTGGYDALGRVTRSRQIVDAGAAGGPKSYDMAYAYDLAGNLTSQTYPSGRVISSVYDVAGRLAGVRNGASQPFYVGGAADDAARRIAYTPDGAVTAMRLNNGLWEHTSYNSRLQPTHIALGTSAADASKLSIRYEYGVVKDGGLDPSLNNGNVQSQTLIVSAAGITPAQTIRQIYTYDAVNRLASVAERNETTPCRNAQDAPVDCLKQVFAYDLFGNRRFNHVGTTWPAINEQNRNATNPEISPATNRMTGAGYAYDTAGNLVCDPQHPCGAGGVNEPYYTYDAENKLKSAGGGAAAGGAEYRYDGDGRRVMKARGGEVTAFVYDAFGKLLTEYTTSPPAKNGTQFLTADHLGSPRVVTDSAQTLRARHDYLPFGEEISEGVAGRTRDQGYSKADNLRQKFTGYERDGETALDFAQARYYVSARGRFVSTDPVFFQQKMLADPQRFNLYVYGRNNPQKYVDPDGMVLKLSGDVSMLKSMIEAWAGDLKDKIAILPDGTVTFAATQADVQGKPGAQLLYDLVNDSNVFVFFAGGVGAGAAAANLFADESGDYSRQKLAEKFDRQGSLIGTRNRVLTYPKRDPYTVKPQPDGTVFAVIAWNTEFQRVQLPGAVDTGSTEATEESERGVGQVVSHSSLYVHEGAENAEFSAMQRRGVRLDQNAYHRAHIQAGVVEAAMRRQGILQGGFAGGLLRPQAPSR